MLLPMKQPSHSARFSLSFVLGFATMVTLPFVACSSDDASPGPSPSASPTTSSTTPDAGLRDRDVPVEAEAVRDSGVDAADAEPTPTPLPAVTFAPCDLRTEGGGPKAECTVAKTLLDPNEPAGPTIDVFVKRYRPAKGKGTYALWLLQGGPGASGYKFEGLAEGLGRQFPDIDFYIPDHRGTGRSSRIACPTQEDENSPGGILITEEEWPACLAAVKAREGSRLAKFTTTNAASDLGSLIDRTRTPGQNVFVMGISYGTYLAHRYVQLFPKQADGVIFDSVAPPGASLARQDEDANVAAKDFFDACKNDAFCNQKMGPDPWAKANALLAKLKMGHCPQIAVPGVETHVIFRRVFGGFLMHPFYRTWIPSIVYRADRCAAQDVTALRVFMENATAEQSPDTEQKLWGWILGNNISFSELWETPSPTAAQLAAIREASVVSRDVTTLFEPTVGTWPTYPADQYVGKYADSDVPMLFLSGGLDPATLITKARVMKPKFSRPNQSWFEVPTASHTVIGSSQTRTGLSCGLRLVVNFMFGPKSPVDAACLANVAPLNFTNTHLQQENLSLFGTADAWEN
jgi:pimeloyl-ACP methyl ester carboxylesterase